MLEPAFANLSLEAFLVLLGFLAVAGMTKGLIGVGMPIVAVPLLSLVIDLPATVALLSIPMLITNIPQALDGDAPHVVLRRLLPLLAGALVGIVVGVHLLTTVDTAVLKPWVGAILIAVVLLMLMAPKLRVSAALAPFIGPLFGLVGGLLGGLAALPGPVVFVYLLSIGLTRDQFVQYSSMFLVFASGFIGVAMGGLGHFHWADLAISTLASVPVLLGMRIGRPLRGRLPLGLFRKVILGVVMISGINLVGKSEFHQGLITVVHAATQTLR